MVYYSFGRHMLSLLVKKRLVLTNILGNSDILPCQWTFLDGQWNISPTCPVGLTPIGWCPGWCRRPCGLGRGCRAGSVGLNVLIIHM